MQAKYIVGPRSMSKINMQLEDIFWNSIPDTRAQPQGLQAVEATLLRAESIWAINLCFFVKGRIQFWQVTWLEGDRNLAIITKTRFRFAESLAPPAKGSLRSPFASGGLSRLRRSCSRFALDFSRASGACIWVNCQESSLWQRLGCRVLRRLSDFDVISLSYFTILPHCKKKKKWYFPNFLGVIVA